MTTKTGNRLGAPRIGEIRIDTKQAQQKREWRENNLEYAREQGRISNAKYREVNKQKLSILKKEERTRRKEREANPDFLRALIVAKAGTIITGNIRLRIAYKE